MAIIKRSTTTIIGLDTLVSNLNTAISNEAAARATADGVLADLATTAKTNLVGAINEVKGALDTEVTARKQGYFDSINLDFTSGWAYNTSSNTWSETPIGTGSSVAYDYLPNTLIAVTSAIKDSRKYSAKSFDYLNTRINNALSNVDPAALDSLTEIVTAFQTADSTLNGAITTLAANSSAAITAEATARADADTAIKNALVAYAAKSDSVVSALFKYFNGVSSMAFIQTASIAQTVKSYKAALQAHSSDETKLILSGIPELAGFAMIVAPTQPISYVETLFADKFKLLNFSTGRVTVDGQTFDIEGVPVVYDSTPATPPAGYPSGFISYSLRLEFTVSSATERASFVGKDMAIQYALSLNSTQTGQMIQAAGNQLTLSTVNSIDHMGQPTSTDIVTNGVNSMPQFNTGSTPWGALIQ